MMAENDNQSNLVLEILRSIRDDITKQSTKIDNLAGEVRALKQHVAGLVQSDLNRDDRFAQIEARLDRIDKRLELVD